MHIWYFYPPYKHSLYRMNATYSFSMSDVRRSKIGSAFEDRERFGWRRGWNLSSKGFSNHTLQMT